MKFGARTLREISSPITAAQTLAQSYLGPQKLFDLSQGVPSYPTAPEIAAHVAHVAQTPDGGRYTARLGIQSVRNAVARDLSLVYRAGVRPDQVLLTAGCNQAFCFATSALCDISDEVLLPAPFYFNHNMWLRLDHITPVYLETAPTFIPDPDAAKKLITGKTRAIVLVTPNNPTGTVIPSDVIDAFADLARAHGIALIVDETYKWFRSNTEPPHQLFSRADWDDTVISLHSFSKEWAIPGYRVGAVAGSPALIAQLMKHFDCITICAPRIAQEAVQFGIENCADWRTKNALEMEEKRRVFVDVFEDAPGGFHLLSCGSFFGWVGHPFPGKSASEVVEQLVHQHGVLCLPGSIFTPADTGCLRLSYANLTHQQIGELKSRLMATTESRR